MKEYRIKYSNGEIEVILASGKNHLLYMISMNIIDVFSINGIKIDNTKPITL